MYVAGELDEADPKLPVLRPFLGSGRTATESREVVRAFANHLDRREVKQADSAVGPASASG
jgi:hypothetical protein